MSIHDFINFSSSQRRYLYRSKALRNVRISHFFCISLRFIFFVPFALYFCYELKNYLHRFARKSTSQFSFDLPKFFNIETFSTKNGSFKRNFTLLKITVDSQIPSAIAAYYNAIGSRACGKSQYRPYIPALREAFQFYGLSRHQDVNARLARSSSTLTVQTTEGSVWFDQTYIQKIVTLSLKYANILIVPSLPSYSDHSSLERFQAFRSVLNHKLLRKRIRLVWSNNIDEAMYLLSMASNLVAQGGPYGALAAVSNSVGKVEFVSDVSDYLKNNEFRWMLRNWGQTSVEKIDIMQQRFHAMGPVHPTCCSFKAFGQGDQEKIVCLNAIKEMKKCWVLSLGSNDKWEFEQDIVAETPCHVQVFDCTGNFTVPPDIRDRVTLHKLCVSGVAHRSRGRDYKTLAQLIIIGSEHSGNTIATAPVIGKIDVEGWEIPALSSFLAEESTKSLYPHQILMEVHANSTNIFNGIPNDLRKPEMPYEKVEGLFADFFLNLTIAGYDLVHRADNPYCRTCSEINLLLRQHAPAVHIMNLVR